jgi:hypothetical protein
MHLAGTFIHSSFKLIEKHTSLWNICRDTVARRGMIPTAIENRTLIRTFTPTEIPNHELTI